jgi:hypothetical protein
MKYTFFCIALLLSAPAFCQQAVPSSGSGNRLILTKTKNKDKKGKAQVEIEVLTLEK